MVDDIVVSWVTPNHPMLKTRAFTVEHALVFNLPNRTAALNPPSFPNCAFALSPALAGRLLSFPITSPFGYAFRASAACQLCCFIAAAFPIQLSSLASRGQPRRGAVGAVLRQKASAPPAAFGGRHELLIGTQMRGAWVPKLASPTRCCKCGQMEKGSSTWFRKIICYATTRCANSAVWVGRGCTSYVNRGCFRLRLQVSATV